MSLEAAPSPPPCARAAVRRLAGARLISLAGTDASAVAVSFSLYTQTGSVRWLTASLLVMFGLGSLVAPLGGALADRHDRLTLMLTCDLIAAGVFGAMALLHTPAAILGLCVAATLAGGIQGPAATAAIPAVAGPARLSWANGLLATGGNVGKTAGRLSGGLLVAALGAAAVFALDGLSFLVSAALVWSVRGAVPRRPPAAAAPARRNAGRAVWAALAADPALRLVIGSSCLATALTSFTMTAEAPLAVAFDAGAVGLGALTASWSLGTVGGSALAGRVLHAGNEPAGLFGGRMLMGIGIGSVAATPVFLPALGGYLLGGLAGGFLLVASTSMLQRAAGDRTRGRAIAAAEGLKTAAFGGGVLTAGWVVAALGPRATYALVGVGVLFSAVPLARLVRLQRPAAPAALAR